MEPDDFAALPDLPPVFSMTGTVKEASTEAAHRHSWHEFVAICSGVAVLESDSSRVPLYNPIVAVVPAGLSHRFLAVESPFSFHAVFFRFDLWNAGDTELRLHRNSELGSALISRLARGTGRDLSGGVEGQVARLFLSVVEEDRSTALAPVALKKPRDNRVSLMVDLIERRWKQDIGIEDLSRVASCSPRHAQRLFREETGMTPVDYIRTHRMIRAAVLLADLKRTIVDISLECGYSSTSAFYSDFKRYHGMAPGELRTRNLGQAM